MTLPPARTRATLLLGFAILLWAGNSIVGRAVHGAIPPFTLSFGRWLLASLILAPLAIPRLAASRAQLARSWPALLALGATGIACFNALLYKGLETSSASNALLIQAAIPASVVLLDRILFATRPPAMQVIGVSVSTLGVAAIVFRLDPHAFAAFRFGPGDPLILGAVAAWSFYTVLLRKRPEVPASVFLFCTFVCGVVAMAPLAALEHARGLRVAWSPGVLAAFAYVGVLPSIVAFFIYNRATADLGPARAGQAITLMPLFGALLSSWLLGEKLHGYHLVGMALILAGIALSSLALLRPRGRQMTGGAPQAARLEQAP